MYDSTIKSLLDNPILFNNLMSKYIILIHIGLKQARVESVDATSDVFELEGMWQINNVTTFAAKMFFLPCTMVLCHLLNCAYC